MFQTWKLTQQVENQFDLSPHEWSIKFESTVIVYHSLQNDEIFVFYQTDLKKQFGNVCFDSLLKLLEM